MYSVMMIYWDGAVQVGQFPTMAECLSFIGRETTVLKFVSIELTQ